jgi:hypothetical protein
VRIAFSRICDTPSERAWGLYQYYVHIRDGSEQQPDRQGRPAQAAPDYCDRTAGAVLPCGCLR